MDEISTIFANAYRSQRLVSRDISNTDADKEVMHNLGCSNHINWGLLCPLLFRDRSRKDNFDSLNERLDSKTLLKVMICLPTVTREETKGGLGVRAAKEREDATPIGTLTLSAIKEGFSHAQTTTVGLNIGEEFQNKVRFSQCPIFSGIRRA